MKVKANKLSLDRRNHLWFDNENVAAPMGTFANKELTDALAARGDDTIKVTFSTYSEDTVAQDKRTYGRRMAQIDGYTFSGWENLVIDGNVFETNFVGTLTRKGE